MIYLFCRRELQHDLAIFHPAVVEILKMKETRKAQQSARASGMEADRTGRRRVVFGVHHLVVLLLRGIIQGLEVGLMKSEVCSSCC